MVKNALIFLVIVSMVLSALSILAEDTVSASGDNTNVLELKEGMKYEYFYQLYGIERNIEIYVTIDKEESWGGITVSKGEDITTATRFKLDKNDLILYMTDPLREDKILDDEIEGYELTFAAVQSSIIIPLVMVYNKQLHDFDMNELIENRSITTNWQTYLGKKNTDVTLEGPMEYNNYNAYKITVVETDESIYISNAKPYLLIDHYKSSSKIISLTGVEKKSFDVTEYNITSYSNHRPKAECDYLIDNLKVEFNASSSYDTDGKITQYIWDFGDGANGTGINPTYEYTSIDNYTATLTVTDDDGGTDSVTKTIIIISSTTNNENNENEAHDNSNEDSEKEEDTSTHSEDTSIPGFELIIAIWATAFVLFLKRKR